MACLQWLNRHIYGCQKDISTALGLLLVNLESYTHPLLGYVSKKTLPLVGAQEQFTMPVDEGHQNGCQGYGNIVVLILWKYDADIIYHGCNSVVGPVIFHVNTSNLKLPTRWLQNPVITRPDFNWKTRKCEHWQRETPSGKTAKLLAMSD